MSVGNAPVTVIVDLSTQTQQILPDPSPLTDGTVLRVENGVWVSQPAELHLATAMASSSMATLYPYDGPATIVVNNDAFASVYEDRAVDFSIPGNGSIQVDKAMSHAQIIVLINIEVNDTHDTDIFITRGGVEVPGSRIQQHHETGDPELSQLGGYVQNITSSEQFGVTLSTTDGNAGKTYTVKNVHMQVRQLAGPS